MKEELEDILKIVIQNIGKFWSSRVLLPHYTNHGIDHSERIIRNIDKLINSDSEFLTNQEKFILITAVYLHDIGMQSPQHSGLEEKENYTLKELDTVRKNHHIASSNMIKESIQSSDSKIDFGLKSCKHYVDYIARLALYHRQNELHDLKDISHKGEKIRLGLLAALLRFGDELDADYQRVEMDYLKLRTIPTLSKFHWWGHNFVESVNIYNYRISLSFRFPEELKNRVDIQTVFKTKILESLEETHSQVDEILFDNELRIHHKITIENVRFTPKGELDEIPKDLIDYIQKKVINKKILKSKEIKLKLSQILPKKISTFIYNQICLGILIEPEFNIDVIIEDYQIDFQFKVHFNDRILYFKEISSNPSRRQKEIYNMLENSFKNTENRILFYQKKKHPYQYQKIIILYDDDDSVEILQNIMGVDKL